MTIKTRIARMQTLEAPSVEPVNLQVRTGMGVPFAGYMVPASPTGAHQQAKPKT